MIYSRINFSEKNDRKLRMDVETAFEIINRKVHNLEYLYSKFSIDQSNSLESLKRIEKDLNDQSTEFLRLHVSLADVKETNSTIIADIDRNFQKNIEALINARKSESRLGNLKEAFKTTVKTDG